MPASSLPSLSPASGSAHFATQAPPFRFSCSRRAESGGSVRLFLAGELDLATLLDFQAELDHAQSDSDRVLLDLRALTLIDCAALSTLFAAEFGLTPKEAARTMRFTHAVARIGEGVRGGALDLATVAAECGFADQPHLDREFREFAGTSPSGWIAEEFPNIQAGGHRYARDWES